MLVQVETHYTEDDPVWLSLRIVDAVCSVVFALEWSFWLWLSRNRLGYILSFQSLVDILTTLPIFISLFVSQRVSAPQSSGHKQCVLSVCMLCACMSYSPCEKRL